MFRGHLGEDVKNAVFLGLFQAEFGFIFVKLFALSLNQYRYSLLSAQECERSAFPSVARCWNKHNANRRGRVSACLEKARYTRATVSRFLETSRDWRLYRYWFRATS